MAAYAASTCSLSGNMVTTASADETTSRNVFAVRAPSSRRNKSILSADTSLPSTLQPCRYVYRVQYVYWQW